jgi:hypothetical protein
MPRWRSKLCANTLRFLCKTSGELADPASQLEALLFKWQRAKGAHLIGWILNNGVKRVYGDPHAV